MGSKKEQKDGDPGNKQNNVNNNNISGGNSIKGVLRGAKPYGRVVINLQNQLLAEEKLTATPSLKDGLGVEAETDLRIYGCELIQTAGILLRLPQVAMATGQVLLQRFYYCKSLVRHPIEHTAMACVSLASKIEEAPRSVRDVINVFTHIRQVNSKKDIQPVILDQNYINLKNLVIKAERRVLKELGFCVHIKHPHKIIVMYLQVLGYEKHQKLMQYSWNYMNDSLRTDVFMRHQPETVACACIYLTSRKLKIPLPKNPHWFSIFGATEKEIRDICVRILRLYNRAKPNIEELEIQVEELSKKYHENKIRSKGTSHSNDGSPKQTGAHNAWGGFISRTGSHMNQTATENKRSRTRSPSGSPGRRHSSSKSKSKKQRSRSRSPTRNHKKSHKRKSYSRSRSPSPYKFKKSRDKKRSRSPSNDRYIDRYDRYEKDRKERDRSYDRDTKYKDDRDRESRKDRDRYEDKRYDKDNRKYDKDDKYDRDDKYRDRDDKYRDRDDKHRERDERSYSKESKKSKHREDRSKSRSKDRRR